jgi:hypothetical protein
MRRLQVYAVAAPFSDKACTSYMQLLLHYYHNKKKILSPLLLVKVSSKKSFLVTNGSLQIQQKCGHFLSLLKKSRHQVLVYQCKKATHLYLVKIEAFGAY